MAQERPKWNFAQSNNHPKGRGQDMVGGSSVLHGPEKMNGRNGQVLLSTWVPHELATAFTAHARSTDGAAAATLRRLVAQEIAAASEIAGSPPAKPADAAIARRGVGKSTQVGVRFKAPERAALTVAAKAQGTSPANWLRSLAIVHLAHRPQWNPAELDALRDLYREVRVIGNNVNQIAHALNIAVQTDRYPAGQGEAAREAVSLVRSEMRRIVTVMTGNFAYWGLPDAKQPKSAPGAVAQADAEAVAAETRRKRTPKRRPARFTKNIPGESFDQ